MRILSGAVSLAVFVALPGASLASISSGVRADASGLTGDQRASADTPVSNLEVEELGSRGAHGYAMVQSDFVSGISRGRNHACTGGNSLFQDKAVGSSDVIIQKEEFTVTSDTLPVNSFVSITICYSYTSDMGGTATFVGGGTGNGSRNTLRILRDLRTLGGSATVIDGTAEANNCWSNFRGSGDFAALDGPRFTIANSFTFQMRVGFKFDITYAVQSLTASWLSPPQGNHVSDGSAGFAFTIGLGSITSGASLQWRGQQWTGSCADSGGLVPENPVPGAGSATLLAAAGCCALRRRRTSR